MNGYQRMAAPRTGRAVIMRDDHWRVIEQEAERMGLSVDAALEAAVRLYQAVNHQGEHFSVHARVSLVCPNCKGSGQDPKGYYDESRGADGGRVAGPCLTCGGSGEVSRADHRPCAGCQHPECLVEGCAAARVMTRRIPR